MASLIRVIKLRRKGSRSPQVPSVCRVVFQARLYGHPATRQTARERAPPRSIYMTGDQIEGKVNASRVGAATEVASGKTAARKYYEFYEDICEIMEEVEMSTPTRKKKEDNVKSTKIIKEEPLKGNKIIKYFKKGMEEDKVFKPIRSLVRSSIKARKQEVGSISEVDTTTELPDNGSVMIRTKEQLRERERESYYK
jgi:hypothetical protein